MIATGDDLLKAIKSGEIATAEEANKINISLPLREKVWPPDMDAAFADRDRARSVGRPTNVKAKR
jgi:hypothetical protein